MVNLSPPALKYLGTLLLLLVTSSEGSPLAASQNDEPLPALPEIVRRLDETAAQKYLHLHRFISHRKYAVVNRKMKFERLLEVEMTYQYPSQKQYRVVQGSTSGLFYSKVFKKILDSEIEYARPGLRITTVITSRNYSFALAGQDQVEGEPCYRLELSPRRKSKYLLRGTIWVSARDFDIIKLDGHPAENPSFWTKDVHLVRSFKRVNGFWLPCRDESINQIRLFGETRFTIEYDTYHSIETSSR